MRLEIKPTQVTFQGLELKNKSGDKFMLYRIFSLLLIMPVIAIASPKQLVCSYADVNKLSTEQKIFAGQDQVYTNSLPIGQQIASAKEFSKQNNVNKLIEIKNFCLASPDLPKITIIFDTDDVNTGSEVGGEHYYESCGQYGAYSSPAFGKHVSDISKITLSATPSIISINGVASRKQTFNVSRKTLEAGYGTSRLFKCKVEDVDTSDNQI